MTLSHDASACLLCHRPTHHLLVGAPVCLACMQDGDQHFEASGIRVARQVRLDPDTPLVDGGVVYVRVLGVHLGVAATVLRRGWWWRFRHRHAAPFDRDVRVVHGGHEPVWFTQPVRGLVHALVRGTGGLRVLEHAIEFDVEQRLYDMPPGGRPSRYWGTVGAALVVLLHREAGAGTQRAGGLR